MTEKSKSVFEKYPKTTLTLLVTGFGLILDMVAGMLFIPSSDHDFRIQHPYFHHALLPNQSQTTHWGPIGYPISTNAMGFRDAAVREIPLISDKHRILFMGDSHTEGVGVSFAESFTGVLLDRIDTSQIEILNAAAVSYSPKLYYYKTKYLIEKVGLDFDELYVFIDISDVQNEYAYEQFQPGKTLFRKIVIHADKQLKRRSFIYYAVKKINLERQRENFYRQVGNEQIAHNNTVDLYHTFFSHFDNDVLLNNPRFHTTISEWYSDESLYRRWGKKGIELMTSNMKSLVKLCLEHDITMTVTVHPWRNNIRKGNPEDRHVVYWRSFARKNKIGFINFYPLFMHEKLPDEVIQTYYIPYDNHWTAAGHRLVADKLFNFIGAQPLKVTEDRYQYHQGIIRQEKQEYDSAILYFSRAIQMNPLQAGYFFQRGRAYLENGQFLKAEEDFTQTLFLDSNYQKARISMKHIKAYRSVDHYTRVISIEENDSLYLHRGKAYLELGRYEKAYGDFEQARVLNPENKESLYYIGYIKNHHMKLPREAIKYFNRALVIDPGYVNAYRERAAAFLNMGAKDRAMQDIAQLKLLGVMVDDAFQEKAVPQ